MRTRRTFRQFRPIHLGTSTAARLVAAMKPPKNEKDRTKAESVVGAQVAKILGNTATIALQSYVDTTVFSPWSLPE